MRRLLYIGLTWHNIPWLGLVGSLPLPPVLLTPVMICNFEDNMNETIKIWILWMRELCQIKKVVVKITSRVATNYKNLSKVFDKVDL